MKILIIEDDLNIVKTIRSCIEVSWPGIDIISTNLGNKGLLLSETESPDVITLDLGLPDAKGIEILKSIRLFSSVPILILTVSKDETDIIDGLMAGADDYVTKPFKPMELLARLRAITRRNIHYDNDLAVTCGPFRFGDSLLDLVLSGRRIKLTRIEGAIMCELMKNPNKVVKTDDLIESIWGDYFFEANARLRVHIRRLRAKIEIDSSKPQFLINKPCVGYLLSF